MSTVLQLIQKACRKLVLPVPTEVVSSTNQQTLQMLEILEEVGSDLMDNYDWNDRVVRTNFVGSGNIAQTALAGLTDYKRFVGLQKLRLGGHLNRLRGPLPFDEWDKIQVYDYVLAWPVWTIIGGEISIYPAPPATDTFYFTYLSKNWLLNGSEWKSSITADDDAPFFDDQLMLYGLYWKWKETKGFDYAEDLQNFERKKRILIGDDRAPREVYTAHQVFDADSLPVKIVV